MLTRVIELSLRHRWVVLGAALLVAVFGIRSFLALPLDAFPDTTPVQVQVNAAAPALGPLEVERQITLPVERALAGLPKLEELRSISKQGLSQVTLRFSDGVDLWFARQRVSERLATVRLAAGLEEPSLGPVSTGLGEVFHYLVRSGKRSPEELRTLHDWTIAPRLRSVRGVAEVNAWGGDERQWHVVVEPERLRAFGISLGDLYLALERNNANVGGGVVDRAGSSRVVLGIASLDGKESIEHVAVAARDGVPVLVRDLASVEVGREPRRGATTADGEGETVLGLGFMLIGENSAEVTRALDARLSEIARSLPADVRLEPVYRRTELVDHVLRTIRTNLFEAALLVVAVLFVFLGNFRAGLVVAVAIPLSLLFAFSAMLRFGIAGTLMSLGAIDFGLIVDSSVILVENAERRLRAAAADRPSIDVIREACVEVRKPTLFGELVIMVVYLPILALEGVEGKMFRPMALTVIFALIGSAIVSMTVMPVLASFVLRRSGSRGETRLVRWLQAGYRPLLEAALQRPRATLVAAGVFVALGAFAALRLGREFVPRLSEGTIVVNTVRLAEISLDESVRIGTRIEKILLREFPDEIDRVWTRTGTAEIATDPMGVELSDVFVTLAPRKDWKKAGSQEELVREMQAVLTLLPGMRMTFLQPIEMRVNEMIAGVRSDLGVKIFGDDLDVLRETATKVETALRTVRGAEDVTIEQVSGNAVLEVALDRLALGRYGLAAEDVLDVVAALGTREVGVVREGERQTDLAVRLPERYRREPELLATIAIPTPAGGEVALARVATIREVPGVTTIQREAGRRRLVVQANVRGRDLGGFVSEVRGKLEREVALPAGYFLELGGQFENLERAERRLTFVVPLALLLVFALLYATYGRVLDSLRIFVGVPFAMVGGILALLLRGMPFSISAAVGFVALSGVSVLGDMVLVARIRQLLDQGLALSDAVREAAVSRLRPVLMTASVAAIGFVPMAVGSGVGSEVQRPLATVVIGGLLTSTALTLLVLPVLFATVRGGRNVADGVGDRSSGSSPETGIPTP